MKKKAIALVFAIAVLVLMLLINIMLKNKQESATDGDNAVVEEKYELTDKTKDDIKTFSISPGGEKFSFTPSEGDEGEITWILESDKNMVLDSSNMNALASLIAAVTAEKKLHDNVSDLGSYGLDNPTSTATVEFKDGSSVKFNLGDWTVDEKFYYLMKEGDPALYLINKPDGYKFCYDLNELIDKKLPQLNGEELEYVLIDQQGQPTIEIVYDDKFATRDLEPLDASLKMISPYKDKGVHSNTLSTQLGLEQTLFLEKVVDFDAKDLSLYGLDEPKLEVNIKDANSNVHLLVGHEIDEEQVYVKQNDKNYVYAMKKSYLSTFYNLDTFKFMDVFIALINLDTVDNIEVSQKDELYRMDINKELLPLEEGEEKAKSAIFPEINGKSVEDKAFRGLFQQIIALAYDAPITDFIPQGNPEITIRFQRNAPDASVETKYFNYNNDFYAVQVDDGPIEFVVSKKKLQDVFHALNNLLES